MDSSIMFDMGAQVKPEENLQDKFDRVYTSYMLYQIKHLLDVISKNQVIL